MENKPKIDDNRPFKRLRDTLSDAVEGMHRNYKKMQDETRLGTLSGLEDLIRRRKMEKPDAKRNSSGPY